MKNAARALILVLVFALAFPACGLAENTGVSPEITDEAPAFMMREVVDGRGTALEWWLLVKDMEEKFGFRVEERNGELFLTYSRG